MGEVMLTMEIVIGIMQKINTWQHLGVWGMVEYTHV